MTNSTPVGGDAAQDHPADASPALRGSCLCGAVRFEVQGQFDAFFLCHCRHCQKDTGSAHAANLFSQTAALRWLAGGDATSTFTLPGTRHRRSFCSHCGSALPVIDGDMLTVPAGSLDDAVPIEPTAHIFRASAAAWDSELDAIPAFGQFPG